MHRVQIGNSLVGSGGRNPGGERSSGRPGRPGTPRSPTDSAQEEEGGGKENIPLGLQGRERKMESGAKPASQRDLPKEAGGWGREERSCSRDRAYCVSAPTPACRVHSDSLAAKMESRTGVPR